MKERLIREDFLKLISVYNISGQSLANHIISDLELNIKIKNSEVMVMMTPQV